MDMPMDNDGEPDFRALEHYLTVYELFLLYQLATETDSSLGLLEPIIGYLDRERPLTAAPFLSLEALQELASQQRLVRLWLVEVAQEDERGWCLQITELGMEAARWWMGAFREMGFSHDRLTEL